MRIILAHAEIPAWSSIQNVTQGSNLPASRATRGLECCPVAGVEVLVERLSEIVVSDLQKSCNLTVNDKASAEMCCANLRLIEESHVVILTVEDDPEDRAVNCENERRTFKLMEGD